MYRAWLSSKAWALAWLEWAQAPIHCELSPGSRLRLGSGLGLGLRGGMKKSVGKSRNGSRGLSLP